MLIAGHQPVKCPARICIPIRMRIRPPRIWIFLPKTFPMPEPNTKPKSESTKVTIPMIMIGKTIEVSRKAKLRPTIKASMLVATAR